MSATEEFERLMTPSEVAFLFRVDAKTVTRWATSGKLTSIRTLGGHRRYWESEVMSLFNGGRQERRSHDNAEEEPSTQPSVNR